MKLSKTQIIASSALVSFISLLLLTNVAFGVLENTAPTITGINTVGNVQKVGGLVEVIKGVVMWVYTIFFIVAVLMLLFAAFTYLTAAGDAEKVKKARDMIIYAAVAIAVALLAIGFSTIIQNFLGGPMTQ